MFLTKRPLLLVAIIYITLIIILRPFLLSSKNPKVILNKTITVTGYVDEEPTLKKWKILFGLKGIEGAKGKFLVVSPRAKIFYGDKIRIQGIFQKSKSNLNPGLTSKEYLIFKSFKKPKILSHGHGNPIKSLAISIKNKAKQIIATLLPKKEANLLTSILLGKKSTTLSEDVTEAFQKTGTMHLLVVSGLHLSILVNTLFVLLRTVLPLPLTILIASFINFSYAIVCGAGTSIVRAAIMMEAFLLSKMLDREKDFGTSIGLAALILLIINPNNLFNIGFQLSFTATISLVVFAPILEERLKNFLPIFLSKLLAVSIAPVIFTMPIILFNFNQLSLVSIITNLLLIFWVQYLVILGFGILIIGFISTFFGKILSFILLPLIKILNLIISFFANLPYSCVYLKTPPFLLIVGYYFFLIYIIKQVKNKKAIFNRKNTVFLCLSIIAIFVWNSAIVSTNFTFKNQLEFFFLDVGQGDSIFIKALSGKSILIDGGEYFFGKKVVVPFLKKQGINYIDMLVLTHAHEDHLGGLVRVLEKMRVGMVLDTGIPHTSFNYKKFLKLIEEKNIKYKTVTAGDIFQIGEVKGYIISPAAPFTEGTNSDLNNNSIVIRLVYKNFSILLTGDLEKEGEEKILENGYDCESYVLKVGHHGSNTSSSSEFLEKVNAKIGIISVGKDNDFGHPHQALLDRLKQKGIKLFRTDEDGAVVLRTDGDQVFIETLRTKKKYLFKTSPIPNSIPNGDFP